MKGQVKTCVLVVHLFLRPLYPGFDDWGGPLDVEAPSQGNQCFSGLPDTPVHGKYGHLEFCPSPLRKAVVDHRMDFAPSHSCHPYSFFWKRGGCHRVDVYRSAFGAVHGFDCQHIPHGTGVEEDLPGGRNPQIRKTQQAKHRLLGFCRFRKPSRAFRICLSSAWGDTAGSTARPAGRQLPGRFSTPGRRRRCGR